MDNDSVSSSYGASTVNSFPFKSFSFQSTPDNRPSGEVEHSCFFQVFLESSSCRESTVLKFITQNASLCLAWLVTKIVDGNFH